MNYFSNWSAPDIVVATIMALAVMQLNLRFGRIVALTGLVCAVWLVMGRHKWRRGYGRGYRVVWQNLLDFYYDKIRRDQLWAGPGWTELDRAQLRADRNGS